MVKRMIAEADGGKLWTRADIRASGLDDLFAFPAAPADSPRAVAVPAIHSETLALPRFGAMTAALAALAAPQRRLRHHEVERRQRAERH